MWHLRQIHGKRTSTYVLTKEQGNSEFVCISTGGLNQFPEANGDLFFIWNFNTYRVLSWNGGHHTYGRYSQSNGQIVLESSDFIQAESGFEIEFKLGHSGTCVDLRYANV